jgi:raffinose/stachyose/melibiose transport system substrate-binding protein
MNRIAKALSAAIALTVIATGCAPGAATDSDSAGNETSVVTDAALMGDVTLTVLDSFTDSESPIGRWMQAVVEGFETKYPNITVERQSVQDITTNLKLKLADANPPDVIPANQGWSGVGDLSASGLLLNLDPYEEAYGWRSKLPPTILQQSMATEDGKNIGQGSLYGVPINQGAFVTVFYNRGLLDELGLEVPNTMQEFEAALEAAKVAGEIPMQLGTQDGWPVSATLLALQAALGDPKNITDAVYSSSSVKLQDTGLSEAASKFKTWADSDYFTTDFVGVSSTDAVQGFVDGEGLFVVWYSGFLPFKDQAQGDLYGQFLLPRADGGPLTGVGAASQQFSVAAGSDSPDAAALFLDYMSSPEAGAFSINNQIIPMFGTFEATTDSPMLNDGLLILNRVTESDGYLPYFDWSTPTMLDVITQQMQLIFDNRANPDDLVDAMQANIDEFRLTK